MPKMRVLIAATGDRPSAIAGLLGVHTPTPDVELATARSRDDLFHHLTRARYSAVILEPRFDGAPADELLIAGSELLRDTQVLILGHPGEPGAAAHQHLLVTETDLLAPPCADRFGGFIHSSSLRRRFRLPALRDDPTTPRPRRPPPALRTSLLRSRTNLAQSRGHHSYGALRWRWWDRLPLARFRDPYPPARNQPW